MSKNVSQFPLPPRRRTRPLKRAALFAGGAVTGLVVSAAASYAVVNTLFAKTQSAHHAPDTPNLIPGLALPGVQAQVLPAAFVAPRATPDFAADLPEPATAIELVALTPAEALPPALTEAPAPEALSQAEPAAPTVAEPAPVVIAGHPEVLPPARPQGIALTAVAAGLDLPARALAHPVARPGTETTPEAFAALANDDASGRAGATLGFAADSAAAVTLAVAEAPATRPIPRPAVLDTAPASAETGLPVVLAAMELPAARPAPRPADLVTTLPATTTTDVVRVASAAPAATTTTEAAPRARRASGICGTDLTRDIPRRRSNAATGSAFFATLGNLSGTERDNQVIAELARGNVPNFLRDLQPVTFTGQDSRGAAAEITICVTPDYLAVGSDKDYVRAPMGLPAASYIAGAFDMILPTPHMVDAIYAQADVHLNPAPMQAGPQMTSTAYLLRHNATIQDQLHGRTGLIAGQKKDVVMASRMASNPGKVAIYGWHRSNTSPIQPVSTVHQASYADYSHGIRLISRTAFLNGRPVDIDDLLTSGRYAYLLNSDGPLPAPVIRIASR